MSTFDHKDSGVVRVSAVRRDSTRQSELVSNANGIPVPHEVACVEALLLESGVWHLLDINIGNDGTGVFGCEDAARWRYNLGSEGIPLWNELKSHLFCANDIDGNFVFVAAHLSAGFVREDLSIRNCFPDLSSFREADLSDWTKLLGCSPGDADISAYGLLNPFLLECFQIRQRAFRIIHVVDDLLFRGTLPPPGTLFTNAGHRHWAVEFEPGAFKKIIPIDRLRVAKIRASDEQAYPCIPSIGILTGNGPESGSLLWEKILTQVRWRRSRYFEGRLTGDIHLPSGVLQSHPALGHTMELHLRSRSIRDDLTSAVLRLCASIERPTDSSTALLTVACNTTPYYDDLIRSLTEREGIRYVSPVESAWKAFECLGLRSAQLLGIGYVLNDEYSEYMKRLQGYGIALHVPPTEVQARIDGLAYKAKRALPGRVVAKQRLIKPRIAYNENKSIDQLSNEFSWLVEAAHNSLPAGEDGPIVLALTELSLIHERWRSSRRGKAFLRETRQVLDVLSLHAVILTDMLLGCRDLETMDKLPIDRPRVDEFPSDAVAEFCSAGKQCLQDMLAGTW